MNFSICILLTQIVLPSAPIAFCIWGELHINYESACDAGMGEPGGLPSMGSHRVGHDWSDLAAAAAAVVMQETRVRSLGWAAPLEKGMALHYSCLVNSMDIEVWWATVCGVAKSRMGLSN